MTLDLARLAKIGDFNEVEATALFFTIPLRQRDALRSDARAVFQWQFARA